MGHSTQRTSATPEQNFVEESASDICSVEVTVNSKGNHVPTYKLYYRSAQDAVTRGPLDLALLDTRMRQLFPDLAGEPINNAAYMALYRQLIQDTLKVEGVTDESA